MTGYLLGNRYRLGDRIGRGGMSEVYRGRDERLGRDVAVKVLRADLAGDPAVRARFHREVRRAAALNHPAIVAVYDTGETAGQTGPVPYIVMEYVDGETVREVLEREAPRPPSEAMPGLGRELDAIVGSVPRHGPVRRTVHRSTAARSSVSRSS